MNHCWKNEVFLSALAFFLFLPLAAGWCQSPPKGEGYLNEQAKAAEVNGVVIYQSELVRGMASQQVSMAKNNQRIAPEDLPKAREQMLEFLIGQELLFQEAKKENIKVDKRQILQRIEKLKSQVPSEVEFHRLLARQNLSEEILIDEMERQAVIKILLLDKFGDKAQPTEEEIRKFYEANQDKFTSPDKVRASHILIRPDNPDNPLSKKQARKRLEDIEEKLREGVDFATLAREESACPSSKNGGDLNFFARGQMVKEFEDVAFDQQVGQVSPIVETPFGYHLIKTTDKKPGEKDEFANVKDPIRRLLTQERMENFSSNLVNELRKKSKVEVFLPKAGS